MKKNSYYLSAGLIGLAVTTLSVASLASAHFGGGFLRGQNAERFEEMKARYPERYEAMSQHFEEMEEMREQMAEAIERNDYEAWRALAEEKEENRFCMTDAITEENFHRFSEMHNLIDGGDIEGARAIADELGLERHGMGGMHGRYGMKHMGFMNPNSPAFKN